MRATCVNINRLEENRRCGMPKYHFNARLDMEIIETFERAHGIVFPESYKQFMAGFNGGMILEEPDSYYTDMTDWEPDGPKWSSFYFFTLDELEEEYIKLRSESTMLSHNFKGIFPLLPICNTPKQETIMLVSQKGILKESPVFISNDVKDMGTYVQIADDFDDFLGTIIDHDGFPKIVVDERNPLMSLYLYENKVSIIATKKETDAEVIVRTTALIKTDPQHAWNYAERGNALERDGQRKLALNDFNRAIELDTSHPFFYYCRGSLFLNYGSARKALIDLDIAVKLEPQDSLYPSTRAFCFLQLGKLQEALNDCNMVLERDRMYKSALLTRCSVYRAMGEQDKANADAELLEEIY